MGAQFGWPQYVLSSAVVAFEHLQQQLAVSGIQIGIADFGGFRSQADTTRILDYRTTEYNAAIATGAIAPSTSIDRFRPIAPYGHSFHDYGAAFDIRFKSIPASLTIDQAEAIAGQLAPSLGLRWGGNFTNPDPVHFELDVPLSQARAMFQAETGTVIDGAAASGGDASAMLGADDVGDDSGEAALELGLEQQDALTGWIVVGAAIVSLLAIAIASRR